MTAVTPETGTPRSSRPSTPLRRVVGLSRANLTLQLRNKLTAGYALVLPLLPLALLLIGDRGEETMVVTAVNGMLLLVLMFPGFYNLLSATVTRRDELVLKRLRTGETTDNELLASLALPGLVLGLVLALVAVPIALALGAPAPANPLLYAVGVLLGLVLFAALGFWTAAWTRNAEAAQMTSLPVIMLAVIGSVASVFPDRAREVVERTPGAAMEQLVTIGWLGRSTDLEQTLGFAQTWTEAAQPLLVLAAWTVLAAVLAGRSMRWEPRH